MRMQIFYSFLGAALLAGPTFGQTSTKMDEIKAELDTLRAQMKVLQAQVDALQKQVNALQDKERKPTGPSQRPREALLPATEGGDQTITTGVVVLCWYQFIPGVEGAKVPSPTSYEGATVRLLALKGKKVLLEGKTNNSGEFRLAAPPGQYLLELVPRSSAEGVRSPIEVTVEKDKLSRVETTITLSAP